MACLKTRAERVCKGANVAREKEHLCKVFVANGYPEEMTRKSLNNHARVMSKKDEDDDRTDTLCLPYIHGLSENVEKAMKDLKIRTVFKTSLTLRRCLTKVKTPADPTTTKGVIYKIPCECGRVYVGETGGTLKRRKQNINEWSGMLTVTTDLQYM